MSSLIKRAAAYTIVSERSLYKWVAEHDKQGEVLSSKTLFRGGRVRNREQLLDDFGLVSATTIHRMLLKVGFRFKKRYRNSFLIEATHIIQWRRKYLGQIKEASRQGDLCSTMMKLGAWLGAATRELELETRVSLPVVVVNHHGLYVIKAVIGRAILGGAFVLGYFDMLNRMLKRYAVPSPPGSTPQTRSVMATLVPST
ncbi:hypothetical protein HPB51_028613 [Rhipicephalus microplus]|uniref:Transposase n=1 Tax=Rhipicephalus microplus TaxID=6941 RepID=A0A9J6CWV5_RHIMP|nr:hypothetical protein HPB51_028613 [Rhipicephalus microplus]